MNIKEEKINYNINKKDVEDIKEIKDVEEVNKNKNKYLPNMLLIGTQSDLNEKALINYITTLAKASFETLNDVKYSIKKINKNVFLYEIHNGSNNLTYLNIIEKELFKNNNKKIILKTNQKNIKITKRSETKIDSTSLIFENNNEIDAIVDYKTKGKLKDIIKPGTAILFISVLLFVITGIVSGFSFYTKYYMLNADYSFNPVYKNILSPIEYIEKLHFGGHSETKYIENIQMINGVWSHRYTDTKEKENNSINVNTNKIEKKNIKNKNDESFNLHQEEIIMENE